MGYNLFGPNARALFHDLWRDPHLVALWTLNESSGAILDRALAYRNNGTASGTPTYGSTMGKGYVGIAFNPSSNEHIAFGNLSALNFTKDTPFSGLLVAQRRSGGTYALLSKYNSANTSGWVWFMNASGQQAAIMAAGGVNLIQRIGLTTQATGVPHMFGMSYDIAANVASGTPTSAEDVDIRFWRNGVLETGVTVTSGPLTGDISNTHEVRLAGVSNNAFFFDGIISMAAVFNAAKSANDFKRWAILGGFG